jgi:hypothetical protein
VSEFASRRFQRFEDATTIIDGEVVAPVMNANATIPFERVSSRQYYAQTRSRRIAVANGASLPAVCLKCARHSLTRRKKVFIGVPPWVYFLVALGLPLTLVGSITTIVAGLTMTVYVVMRKGRLDVSVCERCQARWRSAAMMCVLSVVWLGVGSFYYVPTFHRAGAIVATALLISALLVPICVFVFLMRPRTIIARKISSRVILLSGVHPEAARAIVGRDIPTPSF